MVSKIKNPDGKTLSMDKMMQRAFEIGGLEQLFLKRLIHQKQNECKLLRRMKKEVDDPLIIKCPEAIKFCEKLTI